MLRLETTKWTIKQRYFTLRILRLPILLSLCWGGVSSGRVAGDNANVLEPPETQSAQPENSTFQVANFKSTKWDHNFAFTVGGARGAWAVDQFGPVVEKSFFSRAYFGKFQYTFHLPMIGNLGYVIGSSCGYYWEKGEDDQQFQRVSAVHFPGIHVGLVYSFTPFFRIEGAFETYLERLDRLRVFTPNGTSVPDMYQVSVTMRPDYDWILLSDFFFSESWGTRLEWHIRKVDVNPPAESDGQIIGARLTKRDTWIGLGIIYHLFTT